MEKLLSIIIPVFNVDPYLEVCIESVRKQTYTNLEIILVDDGSNDGSEIICDRYAGNDDRIRVIHTENSGVVDARNTGLKSAKGYYAAFVDADDWLDPDMYEYLIREMEQNQVDVISSGCFLENGQEAVALYDGLEEGLYFRETGALCKNLIFNNSSFEKNGIFPGIWNKVYKKIEIEKFCSALYREMCYGEDAAFLYSYLPHVERIQLIHKAFYHYRMRETSVMHTRNIKVLQSIGLVYSHLYECLQGHECFSILKRQIQMYTIQQSINGINNYMDFDEKLRIPCYILPGLGAAEKIALYGAGKVGQEYAKQLSGRAYTLELWVDIKYEIYRKQGLMVNPVEELFTHSYDLILIAIDNEQLAASIKKDLLARGAEEKKIYWKRPKTILEAFVPFDREDMK